MSSLMKAVRLQQGLIAHAKDDVGYPFGVVAHALKLRIDLHDRGQQAQVVRHRLLGCDQDHELRLDGEALLVDLAVSLQDLSGGVEILFLQGFHGAQQRSLDHRAELQNIILDLLEL